MIALDTNVVLRLVVEDDPGQLAVVRDLVGAAEAAGETCLLTDVVLCEIEWVLLSAYGATRADVLAAVQSLAGESLFDFEDRARLHRALDSYQHGRGDLSDYLIGHTSAALGARTTFTFDRGLAGDPGFTVLRSKS